MPNIIHALLCDDVRDEAVTNKKILIGVFDRFTVADYDTPLPRFVIFCKMAIDDNEPHDLSIDLFEPDGGHLPAVVNGRIHAGAGINPVYGQPIFHFNVRIDNLMVTVTGRYIFVVMLDGRRVGEIPFFVWTREERDAEAQTARLTASPSEPPQPSSR